MSTSLYCPHCGTALSVTADQGGQTLSCPTCQQPVQIPASLGAGGGGTGTAPPSVLGPAPDTQVAGYPRRRSGPNVALIVIGVLAVVGVIVVGVVAWNLFTGGSAAAAMQFMPDDCQALGTFDVAGFFDSALYKKVTDEFPDAEKQMEQAEAMFRQEAGIDLKFTDLSRVTVGVAEYDADPPAFVVVVEMTKAEHADKVQTRIAKEKGFEKKQVGGQTAYVDESEAKISVCFPGDRLVVVAPERTLREVLERGGEPKLNDRLQRAWSGLDQSQTLVMAAALPEDLGGALGGNNPFGPALKKIEAVGLQMAVGSDLAVSGTVRCQDAEAAEDVKDMVNGFLGMAKMAGGNMPKEASDILDSIEVETSAATVRLSAKMTAEQIISAAKKSAPGAMGPGGMPGMGKPEGPPGFGGPGFGPPEEK